MTKRPSFGIVCLIIGQASIFMFVLITYPILNTPAFWQEPTLLLLLRLFSPVIVAILLGSLYLLFLLLTPFHLPSQLATKPQETDNAKDKPLDVDDDYVRTFPLYHPPLHSDNRKQRMLSPHAQRLAIKRLQRHRRISHTEPPPPLTPINHLALSQHPRICISLLKDVSIRLEGPGIHLEVPILTHTKRAQLLAYIAWQRGKPVNRERMIEHIFGHGKDDENASREQLASDFGSHKKLLRSDIRQAIVALNTKAGTTIFPPDLDILARQHQEYYLAECCSVIDLDVLETQHELIEQALKTGMLENQVPEQIKHACDTLLASYTGDFLEKLVTEHIEDLDPWTSSWIRKPYTLYRDYYFQAMWYAAEYERLAAINETLDEHSRRQHWLQSARHYHHYALAACTTRFDNKVSFGSGNSREQGERVLMSERALRRALACYGNIEATHQVDQLYKTYAKQMRTISARAWEPSKETLQDLEAAKAQTNAHRFSPVQTPQVTPHSLPPLQPKELASSGQHTKRLEGQ